jgi:NodT family efflux transporter outer membrane factor (OMF) lipoprotein
MRTHVHLALAAASCCMLCLSACKPVGPNYVPASVTAPPAYREAGSGAIVPPANPDGGAWKPASPSDGLLRGAWWEVYNDPQLNQLEERIAPANQTLRAATEAYLAARDQIKVARADLFPTLSAGVSGSHDKLSRHRPLATSSSGWNYNDLEIGGQASWEPDFWGRVRRGVESASAESQATAAEVAVVDLSLHAELAQDYFALRGLDTQSSLLASTVADYEHQLDLTEQRLKGGVSAEADVALARTQLATVRAQLIDIKQTRAQYEHAIATLINQPAAQFALAPAPGEPALPAIPIGIPSQLAERRPDVAAAERRAAAANAQIGIAISAFYPSITLGGAGGFESTHGGTWIQGPSSLWNLGAQATQLLFDAGRRRAVTDAARHNFESQSATYKATVLSAFNEVEDRLSDLRILDQESEAEREAVAAAQHSLDLANQRYKGGAASYLEVLTAESALLQNQRTANDIETRRFLASVGLVRALGGGWDASQLPK